MANTLAKIKKLAKFLSYVLGRRPDEFGLVTDTEGFVAVKTLLQALSEEEGWRHVRRASLNEVITTLVPAPIEMKDQRIRAKDRSWLPKLTQPEDLSKLLYLAIRRRAYGAAMDKGVRAPKNSHLILASDRAMAERLGRRIDNQPVILTVQVAASMDRGSRYQRYGECLHLTDALAPGTFSGPALPKERPQPAKQKTAAEPEVIKTPGSYFPEPDRFQSPQQQSSGKKRRKEADWKKERRQARKHKSRQQR